MAADGRSEGRVVAIRGAVIDLAFDRELPPIDDAIEIVEAGGRVVVAEIQAHLDAHRARAIALEPTTGRGFSSPLSGLSVAVAGTAFDEPRQLRPDRADGSLRFRRAIAP